MLSNVKMTFACRFASLCIIIFRTPFIHKSFFYLQICKIKFLIMYRFLTGDVIYFLMSLCVMIRQKGGRQMQCTQQLTDEIQRIFHNSPMAAAVVGEPFLPLDPSVYAAMLADKVEKAGAKVYLVNTGWNGTGKRMKLSYTRAMVTAALTGEIEKSVFVTDPTFGVQVPTSIEGVPSELLIPENTWEDKAAYQASCKKLAASFVENFKKYTHMSDEVVAAGPKA